MRAFFDIPPLVTMVVMSIRLLAGIVIAMAVYRNAASRPAREYGIPAIVWAALVLAEPALGLLAYWFLHRPERGITV